MLKIYQVYKGIMSFYMFCIYQMENKTKKTHCLSSSKIQYKNRIKGKIDTTNKQIQTALFPGLVQTLQ